MRNISVSFFLGLAAGMVLLYLMVVPSPDGAVHLDANVLEHAADLEAWAVGGTGGVANSILDEGKTTSIATTIDPLQVARSSRDAGVHVREVVCKHHEEDAPGFTPTIIFVAGLEVRHHVWHTAGNNLYFLDKV